MIRILGMAVAAWVFVSASGQAADVGRYQITPGNPLVLLDTATGKTWRLEEGKWMPMTVVQPKPTTQKPKETTQQRWQRESDARRIQLKKSGPQPAPKPPVRSILEKLAPSQ